MDTYIAYFDETGDDGVTKSSCDHFVLTSIYMSATEWQSNYEKIRVLRHTLKEQFGFHTSQELHTKNLLVGKYPYRDYNWSAADKQEIIKAFTRTIANMRLSAVNVIIDKNKFVDSNYKVLENALKYNIQRIDNDSEGEWNYLIITDKGRLPPMRKTARAIRAYNPIQSKYSLEYKNQPISGLVEDILDKDSKESHFIQVCDLISYFVHLYFIGVIRKEALPNRVGRVIDLSFVKRFMVTLKESGVLNLKAAKESAYGLVIYPK